MEMFMFERKIDVDENLLLYNNLRNDFIQIINLNANFFEENLNGFSNIEELLDEIPVMATVCINKAVEWAIKVLVVNKIFDYSEKVFKDRYLDNYFDYSEYYYEVKNIYLEIVGKEDEIKRNRAIERSSRSKWQGGGFGVKGAIKGALTAGMLNAGTGLVRGIGDSITNSNDRSKIQGLKNKLFSNQEVREYLMDGIIICTWGVFDALIEILSEIINVNLDKFDYERAEAIFENVKKYIEDDEEIIEAILECIKLYPYNQEYYLFLIIKFNDPKNEIEDVANFFGCYGVAEFKVKCLDKYKEKFIDTHLNGEEVPQGGYKVNYKDMEKDLKEIEILAEKLNVDYSEDIEKINSVITYVKEMAEKQENLKLSLNMPESSVEEIKIKIEAIEKYSKELKIDNSKIIDKLIIEQEKMKFVQLSNENNNSESSFAQYRLFEIYFNEKDAENAKNYLIKSATNGYAKAKKVLGRYYLKGKSELNIEKNIEKARFWFEQLSIDDGYNYYLGLIYEEEYNEPEKAKEYFLNCSFQDIDEAKMAKKRLKKYEKIITEESTKKVKPKDINLEPEKKKISILGIISNIFFRILKALIILVITGMILRNISSNFWTIVVLIIGGGSMIEALFGNS